MCYLSCSDYLTSVRLTSCNRDEGSLHIYKYSVPNGTQDRFPSLGFLSTLSLSLPDYWDKAPLPIFAEGLDK
jgi:hypothetical protein